MLIIVQSSGTGENCIADSYLLLAKFWMVAEASPLGVFVYTCSRFYRE
jgi:hypothetical protein